MDDSQIVLTKPFWPRVNALPVCPYSKKSAQHAGIAIRLFPLSEVFVFSLFTVHTRHRRLASRTSRSGLQLEEECEGASGIGWSSDWRVLDTALRTLSAVPIIEYRPIDSRQIAPRVVPPNPDSGGDDLAVLPADTHSGLIPIFNSQAGSYVCVALNDNPITYIESNEDLHASEEETSQKNYGSFRKS
ncbi:hypothetical protein NLJ89_g11633 [Agrocybe chaxingu]|uniref:Uncharacterized protein n=1 Tax=Agrocybe chaxingu TaxID=84603 RepID=A0A9W8JWE8_9AGAR|nr:hypothetical protein NLJ89_g11633 [Agrocybe chaxingu]